MADSIRLEYRKNLPMIDHPTSWGTSNSGVAVALRILGVALTLGKKGVALIVGENLSLKSPLCTRLFLATEYQNTGYQAG